MSFTPASPVTLAAFVTILAGVLLAFFAAVRHTFRNSEEPRKIVGRAVFAVGAWLGFESALVAGDVLPGMPMNGLPAFFVPILVVVLAAGLSSLGRRFAEELPVVALVAFQAFRLPLELVLHSWAGQGVIPGTMTWTGQNWDIVSGVVALVAAPFAAKNRNVAWLANLLGLVLLLNVMRVAVLSAPVPFGWNVTPPLLLAYHLPYALIAPVCVGGALFGHIVLTRALLREPAAA